MWGSFPHIFLFWRYPRLNVSDELERVVVEELEGGGYDLVELRRGGTRSRPVLEVRIDRKDGSKITVDDCARASRAIEARLDAGEIVAQQYVLQVSSPGDRPLRSPADWRRFVGRWASVTGSGVPGGRIEGKILEVDGASGAEVAVLETEKGAKHRVDLTGVKEARLAFHWKA
jgi:ribosome maturation factor RimP